MAFFTREWHAQLQALGGFREGMECLGEGCPCMGKIPSPSVDHDRIVAEAYRNRDEAT